MRDQGMLNYGAADFSWRLWHRGPVLERENVVLVHGYRFPLAARKGRCDSQFSRLDELLQSEKDGFNVWQFEYVASPWGTYETIKTYAARLGSAVDTISAMTGQSGCSIVAYSMGGLIARQFIASGGKARVNKLLTLAVPHMGTMRFEPFSLSLSDRILPRAAAELRPDSRLLWDLNTKLDSSSVPEFAALGGNAWGNGDGVVEMSSTSLSRCGPDGSILGMLYFAGVDRTHLKINRIRREDDEVYRLIHSFLKGGVRGISSLRPPEKPGDYRVPYFLTFALKGPSERKPVVTVSNTGRRYRGMRVLSQGARTAGKAAIFTVQLSPEDEGETRILCDGEHCATVHLCSGQSTVVARPIPCR